MTRSQRSWHARVFVCLAPVLLLSFVYAFTTRTHQKHARRTTTTTTVARGAP